MPRILFVTALASSVVGGAWITADRPAEAAFQGKNGKIAFRSDRDGNSEIYVMNPDGSDQVNISNNPALDTRPAWSADGNWIAFRSNRDGNSEIYKMRADGSGQTRLTVDPDKDIFPAWTSDGRIVFERSGEVYIINADGSGEQNITKNPYGDGGPAGSSTGKVAFFTIREGHVMNWEIYSMNPDGSGVIRITTNPACDVTPNWSPDASRIVFVRDDASDCKGEDDIYVMQADGSGEHRLATTPNRLEFGGAWSPLGDLIVFAGCPPSGLCQIYTMNPSGDHEVPLTSAGNNGKPDWQSLSEPPPPAPPPPPPPPAPGPLQSSESARATVRSGEAKDPTGALLDRAGPPRPLETSRSRDRPEPEAWSSQARFHPAAVGRR